MKIQYLPFLAFIGSLCVRSVGNNYRVMPALLALLILWAPGLASADAGESVSGIVLEAKDEAGDVIGQVPLSHTEVDAEISGHFVRVNVTQYYKNPYDQKIEAVYTFPLSHRGAVDRMTMTVGDRIVSGEVKERGKARRIYEAARAQGYVSALLEQERPNIFTQSLANIEPGADIKIEISYVEVLAMRDADYLFEFPTVVAPRYIPGRPANGEGDAPTPVGRNLPPPGSPFASPTDEVPDADRITPMPVRPDGDVGHDIRFRVAIDSGGPAIRNLRSPSHAIAVSEDGEARKVVTLDEEAAIPNRDFRLSWSVRGDAIGEALFTHTGIYDTLGQGFFTLVLNPPREVEEADVRPRELIFVMDNSGSMSGRAGQTSALAAAKQIVELAIDSMRPDDRFNVISFNNTLEVLWPKSQPNTELNRQQAQAYVDRRQGGGGTELRSAVLRALELEDDGEEDETDRLRIVLFLTDGLVGNDDAIIEAIRENADQTRMFPIGMSHSPNRHLLDEMARVGRGAADYVLPDDELEPIVERFTRRLATPVLTDITLEFSSGLDVVELLPAPRFLPDLYDYTPLVLHGRYRGEGSGSVTIRGKTGGGDFERRVPLRLPASEPRHDTLATLWAREKVSDLTRSGDYKRDEVIELGENFQIMTPYTSFVAVERRRVTLGGEPVEVRVPVAFPKGLSWEGIFGEEPAEGQLAEHLHRSLRQPAAVVLREQRRVDHFAPPSSGTGPRSPGSAARPQSQAGYHAMPGSAAAVSSRAGTQPIPGAAQARSMPTAGSSLGFSQAQPSLPTVGPDPANGKSFGFYLPKGEEEVTVERLIGLFLPLNDSGGDFAKVIGFTKEQVVFLILHESLVNHVRGIETNLLINAGRRPNEDTIRAAWLELFAAIEEKMDAMEQQVRRERRFDPALLAELKEQVGLSAGEHSPRLVILLDDIRPDRLASLKEAGWENEAIVEDQSFVVGRISRERVDGLAQVEGIRAITLAEPER